MTVGRNACAFLRNSYTKWEPSLASGGTPFARRNGVYRGSRSIDFQLNVSYRGPRSAEFQPELGYHAPRLADSQPKVGYRGPRWADFQREAGCRAPWSVDFLWAWKGSLVAVGRFPTGIGGVRKSKRVLINRNICVIIDSSQKAITALSI